MRFLFGLCLLAASSPAIAHDRMTVAAYAQYLQRFSAGDDRYSELYDPQVIFEHDPKWGVLRGRQAIVEFYRKIRTQVKETVTLNTVVIDNERGLMAAEITTELVAIRDGVDMPSKTMNAGDTLLITGTVYYGLKKGRIVSIRSGREETKFTLAKK